MAIFAPPPSPQMPPGAAPPMAARPVMAPPPMAPPPPPMFHDVKIKRTRKIERALVTPVPPEEFGISSYARSIRDCGYCFHDVIKRESELIDQGYDAKQIKKLQSHTGMTNTEELARDTVEERQGGGADTGSNTANREIKITEHYIIMDYEGNDKPGMYKIVTGGEPTVILSKDDEDDVARWEGPPPFAAGCPMPMPHRFFGRSVADLVMDIQRIKTALKRGALNNLYMQTNPRVEVSESNASVNTLDDLLIMRPGGVVRTKTPGGLNWQQIPDASAGALKALQYLDAEREWRTGVTRQGQGVDPNALQNQVATIANQMEDASQAKVKMIARILAETGIKDMFSLLHATIRRHGSIKQTVQLRGKWVTVDPRDWKARDTMTINVGLGTGSKASLLAQVQMIEMMQEKAVQVGLVTKQKLYNTARDLIRLVKPGGDVNAYFLDPSAPPDQNDPALQPPADPKVQDIQGKMQIEQMKMQGAQQQMQLRAQLENKQAEADMVSQRNKDQNEAALAAQDHALKERMALMEFELKERESNLKLHHMSIELMMKARAEGNNVPGLEDMIMRGAPPAPKAQERRPRVQQVVRHPQTGLIEKIVTHH